MGTVGTLGALDPKLDGVMPGVVVVPLLGVVLKFRRGSDGGREIEKSGEPLVVPELVRSLSDGVVRLIVVPLPIDEPMLDVEDVDDDG